VGQLNIGTKHGVAIIVSSVGPPKSDGSQALMELTLTSVIEAEGQ